MKNNSFDTIVNQKLSGHQSAVPPGAWDNIVSRKKKRRYALYWWFFGFLLLLATGIFGWHVKTNINGHSLVKAGKENKRVVAGPAQELNNKNTENNSIKNNSGENGSTEKDLSDVKPGVINSTSDNQNHSHYRVEKKASLIGLRKTRGVEKIKKTRSISAKKENDGNIEIETKPGIFTAKENSNQLGTRRNFELAKRNNFTLADSLFTRKGKWLKLQLPVVATAEMNKEVKTTTAGRKKNKKLVIDVSITPSLPVQVNSRLLTIRRTTATNEGKAAYTADNIHTFLQPTVAYSIAVRRKIAKKLAIGTGLQYSRIKETVRLSGEEINTKYSVVQRLTYVNAVPVLVDDTIATTTSGIRNVQAMNSYDFISLPFFVHHTLTENPRWALSVSGGLYLTIKANYKNSITGNLFPQYASAIKTGGSRNKVNTDIYAGMRLSRTFGKKYKFYVEPEFRYNTGKYILPGMVNYKLIHRAGIAVGFSYELSYF